MIFVFKSSPSGPVHQLDAPPQKHGREKKREREENFWQCECLLEMNKKRIKCSFTQTDWLRVLTTFGSLIWHRKFFFSIFTKNNHRSPGMKCFSHFKLIDDASTRFWGEKKE